MRILNLSRREVGGSDKTVLSCFKSNSYDTCKTQEDNQNYLSSYTSSSSRSFSDHHLRFGRWLNLNLHVAKGKSVWNGTLKTYVILVK